jgi:hypothetical protein
MAAPAALATRQAKVRRDVASARVEIRVYFAYFFRFAFFSPLCVTKVAAMVRILSRLSRCPKSR